MSEKFPENPTETLLVQKSPEQMLEEINKARPEAEWVTYIPDKQFGTTISLPHDCRISGTLHYLNEEGRARLYIDMFTVNEKIQKGGVGARLLQSFVVEGRKYGATELYGHVTSESALKTLARVLGKENLQFLDHHTKRKLDLTYEDALKTSKDGRVDFDVVTDLNSVDSSEWEEPIEKKKE
jgi:hypothetical protein